MDLYDLDPGPAPLLVSIPHAGTRLPAGLAARLQPAALALPDTDWDLPGLYAAAARQAGATVLAARLSRYAIDLNRPPDDQALYATAGTGLVPLETFAGQPLYRAGAEPDGADRARRLEACWRPYHRELARQVERKLKRHGHVVLLDAHSIRSRVPRLFDGQLPDLNLGSFDGASAATTLVACAAGNLRAWPGRSFVLDGRFKGGYITRHYGRPDTGVHALQLEMAQRVYMQEQPPVAEPSLRAETQARLGLFLAALAEWRPAGG